MFVYAFYTVYCMSCVHLCMCVCAWDRQKDPSHPAAVQKQVWRRGMDGRGLERAKAQVPVSSVGEDRAVLLGCTMMAFSVLMFFVVGITVVKPYVNR